MSWENLELEVSENIRLKFRAFKILFVLWLIVHITYMVGIVSSNTTTFMLWVFIFMEVWESYRVSGQAWGRIWSTWKGLFWIILFLFSLRQWKYSHPSGKVARWWDPCPEFESSRYFCIFHIFSFSVFCDFFADWA